MSDELKSRSGEIASRLRGQPGDDGVFKTHEAAAVSGYISTMWQNLIRYADPDEATAAADIQQAVAKAWSAKGYDPDMLKKTVEQSKRAAKHHGLKLTDLQHQSAAVAVLDATKDGAASKLIIDEALATPDPCDDDDDDDDDETVKLDDDQPHHRRPRS